LKLLQKNTGETLCNTNTGKGFLNSTPVTQEIITRIDKWDCIKFKSFCTAKAEIARMK
jgi:hypothetical protein